MATSMLALLATVAVQAAPPTYHMNQRNLNIPIAVNPAAKPGEVREFVLYVSIDQGHIWTQAGVARIDQLNFPFGAPSDGQYWFNVVSVFADGRREPLDINSAPPQMKIFIDTQKPTVRLGTADRAGEDVVVSWEARDNTAVNPAGVKVEYKSAEPGAAEFWYEAPAAATPVGQARFRPAISGPVTVRVSARDLANNLNADQRDIAAAATPPMPPAMAITQAAAVSPPVAPPVPAPVVAPAVAPAEPFTPPIAPPAPPSSPPDHYTNELAITFDYELDRVGPSGIGKVEVYLTQDDGRTWMKWHDLGRDAVRAGAAGKLAVNVRLPEREGLYGFRVVPHSGSQLSAGAPQSGEEPEVRVLLDRTPPEVKLYAPEPDPNQPNALVLGWSAKDANLGPAPVRLQWSDRGDGDWRSIAGTAEPNGGVPNVGKYTWVPPAEVPLRVYLRITAVDLAGNVGEAATSQPIVVDMHKPRGRIKGLIDLRKKPPVAPAAKPVPPPQPPLNAAPAPPLNAAPASVPVAVPTPAAPEPAPVAAPPSPVLPG